MTVLDSSYMLFRTKLLQVKSIQFYFALLFDIFLQRIFKSKKKFKGVTLIAYLINYWALIKVAKAFGLICSGWLMKKGFFLYGGHNYLRNEVCFPCFHALMITEVRLGEFESRSVQTHMSFVSNGRTIGKQKTYIYKYTCIFKIVRNLGSVV
jgi:hypothetical protein